MIFHPMSEYAHLSAGLGSALLAQCLSFCSLHKSEDSLEPRPFEGGSGFETNLMMVKTIYFRIIVNLKIVTRLIQITSTALLTYYLSHLERLPTNFSLAEHA